jgi:hypothetical protein
MDSDQHTDDQVPNEQDDVDPRPTAREYAHEVFRVSLRSVVAWVSFMIYLIALDYFFVSENETLLKVAADHGSTAEGTAMAVVAAYAYALLSILGDIVQGAPITLRVPVIQLALRDSFRIVGHSATECNEQMDHEMRTNQFYSHMPQNIFHSSRDD